MTTRHLKIFRAVYLSGSMTAAAKELFMTQPSVSQAIRELEEHYGVKLFERLYHKLYPTKAGERLFLYTHQILDMFDEMEFTLQTESQNQTLNIGLFFTAGMLAQPWLEEFRKSHPTTELHVFVYKGSELKRMLRCAALDFAVMEETTKDEDLIQELFKEDRLVAVTAADDPLADQEYITVRELCSQPLLLRERGAGVRDQFDQQMLELGITVSCKWESASSLVLLNAAKNKEGIAILPYELARTALDRGEVREVRVQGLDFCRRMGLTWHKDKYITEAMQDFMDLVKKSELTCAAP